MTLGALEILGAGLGEETKSARRVDLGRARVGPGGFDHGALQIVWSEDGADHAFTTDDPRALDELSRVSSLAPALASARAAQVKTRRQGRIGMVLLGVFVALPLILIALVYAFRDPIVDVLLERIPPSFDAQMSQMFEGDIAASSETLRGTALNHAVETIVERLKPAAPASPFAFRVHVQKNPQVSAFAAPGGLVVVYTGLLAEAGSAEEVAGVLAHEIAHVTERHSMRQMLYRIGVLPLMGALVGSPEVASVFEAAGQLSDLGFSRAQEEDADRVGYEILRRARLPTEGMAAFFDTLENKGGASPPALLSTHPGSAERAAALRRRAATDGILVTEPLPIDWTSVVMAGKGAGGKGASAPDAPPPAKP